MSSPQMRKWVYHKAKQLLDELDDVPLSDDSIDKKLAILRSGLREASVELFKRAAESSTAEILESKEYQLLCKNAERYVKTEPKVEAEASGKDVKIEMSDFPKFRKI
ncbi:MAG: hypothetical protein COW84_05160 [Gammaproteobacteria bacterium CG22_combo_CG10-13_8_21_14_all_40_8]|nr:MAG: hypothetical protein COW84_05160 [Gammaproteobacteria bacterium CG22_combo_CG10-13_8_21_14_all_40_8]